MISLEFAQRCFRILQIARRPTKKEYHEILRITGMGMAFVGIVGMVMYVIFSFI
ncbi:MAG: protein translocase SEC61 complex subunit gamma [Candidatus Bilamarchaeaceae archaeon]